jgi:tRNA-dihydrouridine synthase
MYGGIADREIIKNVKSALHIPLIANGDIIDGQSALAMMRDTDADGIAIGRGAVGNPFIFREIISAIEGVEFTEPTIEERVDTALLQLRTAIEEKGERVAIPEARKQIALYLRSFRGAARIRAEINRSTTYTEVEAALKSALKE